MASLILQTQTQAHAHIQTSIFMWDCDAYHNIAVLRYHKFGLDHICAWESELLVIVVCSYEAHTHWHTAAATRKASHIIQHFSQELTIQIENVVG